MPVGAPQPSSAAVAGSDPEPIEAAGHPSTTLPTSWYLDPEVWRLERERIFRPSWHYVGHLSRLDRPGDYVCTRVGQVPLVVTRDLSGELNALINVCRHRLHEVAFGDGNRQTLQCPYHAWTYDLNGTLRAAPRSELEPGFDRSRFSLLRGQVATLGPLVFACADDQAPALPTHFGELADLWSARDVGLDRCRFVERREYDFRCNWKAYVDNALECYHCPVAHRGLSSRIDVRPQAYRLETYRWSSAQLSHRRSGDAISGSRLDPDFQFYYLWPTTFLGTATGSGSYAVHRIEPVALDRCRLSVEFFFGEDVDRDAARQEIELNEITLSEDKPLVESVQRGLESRTVESGRLLSGSESLVAHFQRLVRAALADGDEPSGE